MNVRVEGAKGKVIPSLREEHRNSMHIMACFVACFKPFCFHFLCLFVCLLIHFSIQRLTFVYSCEQCFFLKFDFLFVFPEYPPEVR